MPTYAASPAKAPTPSMIPNVAKTVRSPLVRRTSKCAPSFFSSRNVRRDGVMSMIERFAVEGCTRTRGSPVAVATLAGTHSVHLGIKTAMLNPTTLVLTCMPSPYRRSGVAKVKVVSDGELPAARKSPLDQRQIRLSAVARQCTSSSIDSLKVRQHPSRGSRCKNSVQVTNGATERN